MQAEITIQMAIPTANALHAGVPVVVSDRFRIDHSWTVNPYRLIGCSYDRMKGMKAGRSPRRRFVRAIKSPRRWPSATENVNT